MRNKSTIIKVIYITMFFTSSLLNAQNSWSIKNSLPTATGRYFGFSFTVNGKGYTGGGTDGVGTVVKDFWEYDPITDVWSQKQNIADIGTQYGRTGAVGFGIGNLGYFGTGNTSGSPNGTSNFYEYNPTTNLWTAKANFAGGTRVSAVGFSIGNKGYIGTGTTNYATLFNDFWEYNPTTDSWTQKANFPGLSRDYATGFSIGGKGYIGTGNDNSGINADDFYEYNPVTDSWSQKANFGGGKRFAASGFSIGSFGYIGMGQNSTNTEQNDFWEYSSINDTWTQRANFTGGIRYGVFSFSIGNKGYFGGGSHAPTQAADFREYSPCSLTASVVSQTNLVCNNTTTGSVTVSATAGSGTYTYSWSPNGGTSNVATNLSANNYTCFISDNNSCSTTQTVAITQPSAITSSISSQFNLLCNGANTGSATITANGGTGSYTYSWSPTGGSGSSFTNQNAGTYTCTIKDVNLCSKIQTVTITAPVAITTSISAQTNVSCNGGNNSAVFVSAIGGTGSLTYTWVPSGGNAALANGLTAGNYTCNIKDANNCLKSQTVIVTQPNAITTSISSQTNVSCFGGSNAAATISVTSVGTITYTWLPSGGNNATASGLNAGNYNCTITDGNGCNKTQTLTVTQPNAITTSISSQTNVSCFGGSNAAATISVSATGSITYTWLPSGGNNATANGLNAGNYNCTITDGNGCNKTQSLTITQPNAITTISTQSNVSCFSGSNGTSSLTVNGGTGSYTYTWLPSGGSSSVANNLSNGTYTALVSDINNCTKSTIVAITEPTILSVNATITSPTCLEANDGSALLNISGGVSPYAVNWNNGITNIQNNNLSAGNYSVNVTDANTCTYTLSIVVLNASLSCFIIPNGFSPNGDGINDTWEIAGISNYPNAQVTVLNRWGQEVFKITNYTSPWNGSYNGNVLPTADYYYIIKLDDSTKALTGTITIKR
jgi:gliding motility-associated-like protein